MNITQKQKGILFMILSALSFASMQVVVRMSREIPTMEQICVRNLFILIVSFFIIRKKRGSYYCLLYTSPSPRDGLLSRMPSSA